MTSAGLRGLAAVRKRQHRASAAPGHTAGKIEVCEPRAQRCRPPSPLPVLLGRQRRVCAIWHCRCARCCVLGPALPIKSPACVALQLAQEAQRQRQPNKCQQPGLNDQAMLQRLGGARGEQLGGRGQGGATAAGRARGQQRGAARTLCGDSRCAKASFSYGRPCSTGHPSEPPDGQHRAGCQAVGQWATATHCVALRSVCRSASGACTPGACTTLWQTLSVVSSGSSAASGSMRQLTP